MGGWCDPQSAEHISLGAIMQSDTANALMYTAPSTFIHGLSLYPEADLSLSALRVVYACRVCVCPANRPPPAARPPSPPLPGDLWPLCCITRHKNACLCHGIDARDASGKWITVILHERPPWIMRAAIALNLSEYVKRFFALLMLAVFNIDFNSNKIMYLCAL